MKVSGFHGEIPKIFTPSLFEVNYLHCIRFLVDINLYEEFVEIFVWHKGTDALDVSLSVV